MKKMNLKFGCFLLLIAIYSCQKSTGIKEKSTENINPEKKYGISIKDDMLRFESFNSYDDFLKMSLEERIPVYEYIDRLPNFVSKKESRNNHPANSKSASACNCDIDDDYINSIINTNFMFIIENFVVKLNNCNQMVYVSDELAVNYEDRKQALISCDFSRTDFYVYTFNHVVEEELPIVRDSLNGIFVRARCQQVAISNRLQSTGAGSHNGQSFPAFEIRYTNWGVSGTVKASAGNLTPWNWSADFHMIYFQKRCEGSVGPTTGVFSMGLNSATREFIVHQGTRLTNHPTSTAYLIKYRLSKTSSPTAQSPFVQIVP